MAAAAKPIAVVLMLKLLLQSLGTGASDRTVIVQVREAAAFVPQNGQN
jgi:hypothetical protein